MFIGGTDVETETPNTLATWCGELTHLKKPWCSERLKAGGEGDDRGWMASPTQWTWVWVDSRSWWWTGSPGVLRFMGSQRVRHDWVTELNWTLFKVNVVYKLWLFYIFCKKRPLHIFLCPFSCSFFFLIDRSLHIYILLLFSVNSFSSGQYNNRMIWSFLKSTFR